MKDKVFFNTLVNKGIFATLKEAKKASYEAKAMLEWLRKNQPQGLTWDDGTVDAVVNKFGRLFIKRTQYGKIKFLNEFDTYYWAIQLLKEFRPFLDRVTGTVRYPSIREGRKARRAQKAALYENE